MFRHLTLASAFFSLMRYWYPTEQPIQKNNQKITLSLQNNLLQNLFANADFLF